MAIDEGEVRAAFEEVNVLLAGRRADVVIAALQDLLVASICFSSGSKGAAKSFCRDVAVDLQKTIDRNFEHYHDQANAARAAARRSH